MPIIVAKFGGTSLKDKAMLHNVAQIALSDARRRVLVVSAPGKRSARDEKVTDLLARFSDEGDASALSRVRDRFMEIAGPGDGEVEHVIAQIAARRNLPNARAYIVSRGEYLCARLLARATGFRFMDAAELVFFRDDGALAAGKCARAARALLSGTTGAVVPGFYGARANDEIQLFPRGGSDITGAILAWATGAALYENWTDVDGVYDKDPALYADAQRYDTLTYAQMRALCQSGARVLHPDALAHAEKTGVPVRILCTMRPDAPGTMIAGADLYNRP